MTYLSEVELRELGLRCGTDVRISRDARLFGLERITIGSHVRIDSFCVVSAGHTGKVEIADHIHISSGVRIFGEGSVVLGDFSTVSAGSTLHSASDDFSGAAMIGPMVPEQARLLDARPIVLAAYAAVGAHCLVLPGVEVGEGAVLGAMSMANRDLEPWTINVGVPCQPIRARERGLINLAADVRKQIDGQ